MNKIFKVILLVAVCSTGGWAQSDSLQRQINDQVWRPFIKSFNDRDDDAFAAVHSKDIIRVAADENVIFGYSTYFRRVPPQVKKLRMATKRNIELRFVKRIAADGKGYEVGYYKTTQVNAKTNETSTSYGKFHVVLRKESGVWKILVDADESEGTSEEGFLKGQSLD